MMLKLLTLVFVFSAMASPSFAITLQQMTEEQRAAIVGEWKMVEAAQGAIPWELFEKTKEKNIKQTFDDGTYSFSVTPEYPESIKSLNNKEIKLTGYMFPLETSDKQSNFLFGPYPMSCPFHYHVGPSLTVEVLMSKPMEFSYDPITIVGTFDAGFNAQTGVFYYLRNAKLAKQ